MRHSYYSQTPFGPHIPANAPRQPVNQHEDISTIFVVGFPDDMQEREFQNMFTFSAGFEAATLKIPNKEYNAYGAYPSARNDPYNLVTVNQGGVLVDARDGTMTSWPAVDDPHPQHWPPRKQIIGFAKFRTKDEALAAKETLQGKRVDMEKGAVLKAEMAKKNLHTKRGVPGSASMPTTASHQVLSPPHPYPIDQQVRVQQQQQQQQQQQPWRGDEALDDDRFTLGPIGLPPRGPRERAERIEEEDRDRRRRTVRAPALPPLYDPFAVQRQPPTAISPPASLLSPLDNHVNGINGINGFALQQSEERVLNWADSNARTIRPPQARRSPSPPSTYSPPHPISHSQQSSGPSDSRASSVAGGSGSEDEMSQGIGNLAVSTSQGNTSPQLPSPASGASSGGSTRNGVDQNPPINTLYVGNLPTSPSPPGLPPDALEASLRDLFQSRPGFRRLSFKQKGGGPMCFVEFEDVQYATKTLNELYGHNLNGLVRGGGIRLSFSKNPLGVRTTPTTATNGVQSQQQQAPPPPQPSHQVNGYGLQEDRPMIRRGVAPAPLSAQYPPPPPRFSASAGLGPASATVPSSSSVGFDPPLSSAPLSLGSEFSQQHPALEPIPQHHRSNMYAYSLTTSSSFAPFSVTNQQSPLLNHLPSHSHPAIPDQEITDHLATQTRNVQQQHHYQYNHRALSPPQHLEAARAS